MGLDHHKEGKRVIALELKLEASIQVADAELEAPWVEVVRKLVVVADKEQAAIKLRDNERGQHLIQEEAPELVVQEQRR
jgi:hypothetical protein